MGGLQIGYPASKLSYLGEWKESRKNARVSAEAARGTRLASLAQIGELARRLQIGLLSLRCRQKFHPVNNGAK